MSPCCSPPRWWRCCGSARLFNRLVGLPEHSCLLRLLMVALALARLPQRPLVCCSGSCGSARWPHLLARNSLRPAAPGARRPPLLRSATAFRCPRSATGAPSTSMTRHRPRAGHPCAGVQAVPADQCDPVVVEVANSGGSDRATSPHQSVGVPSETCVKLKPSSILRGRQRSLVLL
jgi:hypothetical protein